MTVTYTFEIFYTLDGYGSYGPDGYWGGYWGKQGPELLSRRLALFDAKLRMVSEPPRFESSCRCWPRVPKNSMFATRGSPR